MSCGSLFTDKRKLEGNWLGETEDLEKMLGHQVTGEYLTGNCPLGELTCHPPRYPDPSLEGVTAELETLDVISIGGRMEKLRANVEV